MSQPGPSTAALRRMLPRIPRPASLFSGLRREEALAPDNIIFFKQTDAAAFRPEGVSDNHHHRFELVTVLRKGGLVRVGEHGYLLEPGEAALIFPNQFHHYMDVEAGRLEWLFITFELGEPGLLAALRDAPRRLGEAELALLGEAVKARLARSPEEEPDTLQISHLLATLLRRMLACPPLPTARRHLRAARATRDTLLERINQYVRDHLARAPGIEALAQELGYSVSHLRAIFRDELGLSLGRYWRESRLSRAAELLQSGQYPVADVARQTGFDSPFSFSRAFKRTYGIPPKAYSRRLRTPNPTTHP